ncbi:MAG: BPSL1445 family SYLF domain-containing lipoprotein [Pseudomonadales bacterium]
MSLLKRTHYTALLAACLLLFTGLSHADSREEIDARVEEALTELYTQSSAAKELAYRAAGVLVFPNVVKGGFILGGEYGEGALLVNGETVDYYNIASAALGVVAGLQAKSEILLFMDEKVLNEFRASRGWTVGADADVAIATLGTGGTVDFLKAGSPVVAFVFANKGLMINLSIDGSKITRIRK